MEERLKERFEIKSKKIGLGKDEVKEARVLTRVVRVTPEGWEYEADQRHAELIVKTLGLEESKEVSTPGEDDKPWKEEEEAELLKGVQAREYRALSARANYLALDRSDIQYATKECCRGMSCPTVGDWRKLKRLGRYLRSKPRVISKFRWQCRRSEVTGFSDSDWAGCRRTAKSTSGGLLMVGSHCVKSWSTTQKSVTLSSGEAELVACVKLSAELLGMLQLLRDWGLDMEGRVMVDSAAAIGVVSRRGNGKLRHVKVGMLWIQERVEDGDLKIDKVKGEENPADLMTKHVPVKKITQFMQDISQDFEGGRAEWSLKI
jgi:hypothetical protein